MLYRNEFLDLLFESMRTSDHRFFSCPIIKQDLWHIGKLPAMLQSAQPEIPVFQSLNWHGAIVSAVLLPNRAPINSANRNVVPSQQPVPIKRSDMPPAFAGAKVFGISVNDTNLRIHSQDSNSM